MAKANEFKVIDSIIVNFFWRVSYFYFPCSFNPFFFLFFKAKLMRKLNCLVARAIGENENHLHLRKKIEII